MHRPIKKDVNYLQNLVDYAKKNIKKGYSEDSLRWALIGQGHSRIEIDKAISLAKTEIEKERPRMQQPPQQLENTIPKIDIEDKKPFWRRLFD